MTLNTRCWKYEEYELVWVITNLLLLDTPSSLLLVFWLFLDEDEGFFSRDEDEPVEHEAYKETSLSCLLFVLEILFTLFPLLELCFPSLSFSFSLSLSLSFSLSLSLDDEELRDEFPELDTTLEGMFKFAEWGICKLELEEDPLALLLLLLLLLDFFCLLLVEDDVDSDPGAVSGSPGLLDDLEDWWVTSGSFSGEEGESLEFVSCVIGLYGGIGLTFPLFF